MHRGCTRCAPTRPGSCSKPAASARWRRWPTRWASPRPSTSATCTPSGLAARPATTGRPRSSALSARRAAGKVSDAGPGRGNRAADPPGRGKILPKCGVKLCQSKIGRNLTEFPAGYGQFCGGTIPGDQGTRNTPPRGGRAPPRHPSRGLKRADFVVRVHRTVVRVHSQISRVSATLPLKSSTPRPQARPILPLIQSLL